MSVHIIELNDRNVRLRNGEEILVQSPGYANIMEKSPIFGEDARKVARLHPRQTFTQFWSQLSLDPLVNSNSHFRHQADLAFAHLNDIAGQHDLKDEVIFAVPSNYNRNQLSILLGLVQSCEFDAAGLADMPLLLTGNAGQPEQTVYLDIQLHQSVLTTFAVNNGMVVRDKVVQIPGGGLIALQDAWVNMITDEFIRQSRFDPHHNAETEQYVYNQLEDWVARAMQDNEILMEINNKGSVYQARINCGHFEQRVKNIFARIKAELDTIPGNDYELHLAEEHANLPGITPYLNNITAVRESQLLENCLAHLDHIRSEPGSLSFITSLPSSGKSSSISSAPARTHSSANNLPSHVLVNNIAYALPASLHFGPINGHNPAAGRTIQLETTEGSGDLRIAAAGDEILLEQQGKNAVILNGRETGARTTLKLGDTIRLPGSDTDLRLIQVE